MSRLVRAALALLWAVGSISYASTSAATATITDSDGQTWNSGTFTATIVAPNGGTPTIAGVAVAPLVVNGSMSATGVIAAVLTDTSSVQQSGTTYTFRLCPNTSTPGNGGTNCATITGVAVTGATPNLSSALSAGLKGPRFPSGPTAFGYLDLEVTPNPPVGSTYFNTGTVCGGSSLRQLSQAGWQCGGSGGSSAPVYPVPAGSLADYTFLDGTGTVVTDKSGNGNNGTLGTSTQAPTWTTTGLQFTQPQTVVLPSTLNGTRTYYLGVYINPLVTSSPAYTLNSYPMLVGSSLGGTGLNLLTRQQDDQATWAFAPVVYAGNSFSTTTNQLLAGFHVIAYTLGTGGGDLDHVYVDGIEIADYANHGSNAGKQTSGNLFLGASNVAPFTTSGFRGTYYRAVLYSGEHTATQVLATSNSIRSEIASRGVSVFPPVTPRVAPQLFAIGDSITYGAGLGSPTTQSWPANLSLTNQPAWTINNYGLSGVTAAAIFGSAPWREGLSCPSGSGYPSTVILFAGTNDVTFVPYSTPVITFGYMGAYIQQIRAMGCRVFIGTMISRTGQDTKKNALDAYILDGWKAAGAEGVIDFAANPLLGADGAYSNTTYFQVDGIHPTAAGQLLLATAASNTLNYYFGFNTSNPNVVTATTYQMLSSDGAITAAPTANAAYTMPDCTGPSGATYTISNPQSAFTVSIVGGTGQPINGQTGALTIPSNTTVTLRDVPNPKSASGCSWRM